MKKWEVLNSEDVFSTDFLTLTNKSYRTSKGAVVDNFATVKLRDYVVVFAITPDKKVLLVSQYKHGVDDIMTELPAGLIDAGETPAACAARELREETGYVAKEMEYLGAYYNSPGKIMQKAHLFLARNAVMHGKPELDENEDIKVKLVDVEKISEMMISNSLVTGACSALAAALAFKKLGI